MVTTEQVSSILRALSPRDIKIENDIVSCIIGGVRTSTPVSQFESYIHARDNNLFRSDTSVFIDGYFEQAVELQGRGPNGIRLFREEDAITLKHEQTGFSVEIGSISSMFIMSLTDTDTMPREFRRFAMLRSPILRERDNVTLTDMFLRIYTIKVTAPVGHAYAKHIKQLRAIADASLYNVAYGYSVGIVPIKSWERSLHFLGSRKAEAVQFPLRIYNQELVAYYQMALGGESLILSYLALYKILEFFFTAASEHILHEKIVEHLVSPDFSHTKVGKLRDLAKVIRKFDQKMDERRMLQTVLEQRIDREALRMWIEEFDKENSDYFKNERDLFGDANRVDVSDNQIFPSIGARIYHIRNALVHNKEGELSRFVPFSGQEKILVNEAPLLRRIAEELIIKSGKDLQL